MEVLLLLSENKHGVTRLRYKCESPAHAAFIAFNFEPHCTAVYVTKEGEDKPFIKDWKQFAEWYESATIHNDVLTFKK